MHEPPVNLTPAQIVARLRAAFGITATDLVFLPLGHDAAAWVYRVQADDGGVYFLKVRLRVTNEAGLLVPRYLQNQGIRNVVAPLPGVTGALWTHINGYALILYPFVTGTNGIQRRPTDDQWTAYGRLLRQIHETALSPDLTAILARDMFSPVGAAQIRALDREISRRTFDEPAQQALAQCWTTQRDLIHALVERAETLGRQVAQAGLPLVLCHADIHTGNILLDTEGAVWIVDWDEALLAPRERDLMFVVGGISSTLVTPRDTELVLRGYGEVAVNSQALAYYRYAWAVSDIWAYADTVFHRPDLSVQVRRSEVDMFRSLFAPGNIVSIARA